VTLKIHDPNAQRSYKDLVYCLTAEVRVTIFGLRCREIGSVWLPDEAVEPFTSRDADRRSGLGIRLGERCCCSPKKIDVLVFVRVNRVVEQRFTRLDGSNDVTRFKS